jgi:hypothetical protein
MIGEKITNGQCPIANQKKPKQHQRLSRNAKQA